MTSASEAGATPRDQLEGLFTTLLTSEFPLVVERAVVKVGGQTEFSVSPYGPRVEIRFGAQALGNPNLMQIVHEAGLAAQQLLMGSSLKSRHAVGLTELHAADSLGTIGNQLMQKLLQTGDRSKAAAARNWLSDSEGIPCSVRREPKGWTLRVETHFASCARASLKLFHAEWKVASGGNSGGNATATAFPVNT